VWGEGGGDEVGDRLLGGRDGEPALAAQDEPQLDSADADEARAQAPTRGRRAGGERLGEGRFDPRAVRAAARLRALGERGRGVLLPQRAVDQAAPALVLARERGGDLTRVGADRVAARSADLLVRVRPLVGFRVSDTTPRAGQRVRFRGTVRPPHDGSVVSIQRKRADGRFVTVARTRLRDAGDVYSRYGRRLRVRRTGTYRVRIAGHADHAAGFSRERTLTVGG
jgi:hypothetical protein